MSPSKSMRAEFGELVYSQMAQNPRIWLVTGDLGFRLWDRVRDEFPDRFLNVGSAEQTLMGIGVGLALSGKIPLVYSITPFLLYRPFETIRNYVNNEQIPVKLIGSGRGRDYSHDGFSHWAEEDRDVMKLFSNIESRWPDTNAEMRQTTKEMLKSDKPWYINLKR